MEKSLIVTSEQPVTDVQAADNQCHFDHAD